MAKKHRILLVDDSRLVHQMLTDALSVDPEIEVVGTAINGREAVEKVESTRPNLIIMDIEMPGKNGIETVKILRKDYTRLPIIMFSSLTEKGANATMQALEAGANDYVTKPEGESIAVNIATLREVLIPRIHSFCTIKTWRNTGDATPQTAVRKTSKIANRCDILAIGISTGGPVALAQIMPKLPANMPVPIVMVQHMQSSTFTQRLASRLNELCAFGVCEAEDGMAVEAGKAYLAPGSRHMELRQRGTNTVVSLNDGPPVNSCRPAVDILYSSVARCYGKNTLALVMTGMGNDGLVGSRVIKECDGRLLIQDEQSSQIWGMPGCIDAEGLQDETLPLDDIAAAITRNLRFERDWASV